MSKILIVDGSNQFLRFWHVIPSMDSEGKNNGGVVGTLQSLAIWTRQFNPDKIVIVFDGSGGSVKRRSIVKNYKEGRKPLRFNRSDFNTPDSEDNMNYQRGRLFQYLDDLPITQIMIPQVEADDVIAYVTKVFIGSDKVVVSSDKDFFQLITDKISVYNPTDKRFITDEIVQNRFGVHICNIALARAFCGDPSDNLKGIKGIGFKTLIKLFPEFSLTEKLSLDQLFAKCEQGDVKYKRFLDNKEIVINNYKVMQLENSIIGLDSIHRIEERLEKKITFNATSFRIKLYEDGIVFNDSMFQPFRILGK